MRVPDLRIEAGYKNVDLNAGGRTQGFLAGAGLTLPLFDRGTGQQRAAEAEAREHEAGRQLALEEKQQEVLSAHELAVRVHAQAVHFRRASADASRDLTRIANAGYEGGEMGMFELLDAFRGAVDDELTALEMELAARHALIELHRLTGRGLP
jgi:cobalt-zinc-cadmium efflux system outer membrane protein